MTAAFDGNGSYMQDSHSQSHQIVTSNYTNTNSITRGALREDHLFTDPQLLKSIQMSYNDIKASKSVERPTSGYVAVGRQTPVKEGRLPVQFTPESKQNASFIIQTKPAQELYVENTNVAPPTHFYYMSPVMPASPGSTQVIGNQRTFIVGATGQPQQLSRPQSQSRTIHHQQTVFLPQPSPPPIIITPPSLLKQTTATFSPSQQPPTSQIQRSASTSKFTTVTNTLQNTQNTQQIDTVSRVEYERCLHECRLWEQKYNELYQRFSTMSRTRDMSADEEVNQLRQENYELEQRVVMYERADNNLNEKIERHVSELINRYKGSALKETEMLFDRFRLECRQMDRDRDRQQQSYY